MSITVPIYGFGGGGGAPLNFEVVGNPQPNSPKENTIWVDTDVKITRWIFSATEPENPVEGMIWIFTGASSVVGFNALKKKNGIQVYPLSAQQYISGAWTDKSSQSYQNGEWKTWIEYLYKEGDEYTSVTGGFSKTAGNNIGTQTLTKLSHCLRLVSIGNISGGSNFTVSTAHKIDVTPFSTLCARIRHTDNGNTSFLLGVDTRNGIMVYEASCALGIEESTADTVSLDISSMQGDQYILLGMSGRKVSNSGECDVYEVYLK